MKSVRKNEPAIRFNSFSDAWEQCKLWDVFKKDTQKNKDLEFHSDSVISVAKMKLSPPSAKSSDEYMKTYNKIWKGNIAFEGHTNYEFPNGRFVLNDCQNGIVSHIYDVYSAVDKYNNEFMKRYINNPDVMRKILINATSSARMMKSLNSVEFLKQSILLPILSEQQKIGGFFYQLDNAITLHQRKLEALQQMKKGFLQQMFPTNGETMPRVRFAYFEEEWELRKLGELGSVAMNKRIFKEQTNDNGDIPFFKIGTFGSKADAFITRELFEEYKAKYPYPKTGDLLISASGSIGRIVEYTGKDEYFQDSNIVWLNHNARIENSFLKQFYSIVKWEGLEGSTIKRLYNKNILETEISFPDSNEQQKIGSFFKQLDDMITLHQQKLDQLKILKKAYLQNMFI